MKLTYIWVSLLLITAVSAYAQDAPHSVGPAPINNVTNNYTPVFTDQVGTRAFTQIASGSTYQFGKSFMESCTVTNIGAPFTIQFPGGLMYRNGVVYTWNQSSPFQIWEIDTVTGVHTLRFNMTGIPHANLTGMCWDGTTMYGVSTNLTQSQIFTVNMTTGACTPIGVSTSVCAGAISLMGCPGIPQYSLFSLDIVADNCYKWHKTTGAATLVGPLTVPINFGQDGGCDPNDNKFYCMVYNTGAELRVLDTATGALGPVLCTYTAQATGIALKFSPGPPGPPTALFCRNGLNIPILDHSTAKDSVQVNLGSNCRVVYHINVRIDTVVHTWDSDLSFYIQKGNVGVKIINRVGNSGDNFIGTILNDSAAIPIESGTAPFTGTFRPSNPLTAFHNTCTDGYWKLLVTDTSSGDSGFLKRWCLQIIYNCGPTCITGGIHTVEIPNTYSLHQNYPNPFNPRTTIKFGLPQNDNVKLTVFDVLGKEVIVLVNEFKTANTYEVDFDGTNLSSGIYFYKLEAGDFYSVKKMLMIK